MGEYCSMNLIFYQVLKNFTIPLLAYIEENSCMIKTELSVKVSNKNVKISNNYVITFSHLYHVPLKRFL